jgi:hypothetical protein
LISALSIVVSIGYAAPLPRVAAGEQADVVEPRPQQFSVR